MWNRIFFVVTDCDLEKVCLLISYSLFVIYGNDGVKL